MNELTNRLLTCTALAMSVMMPGSSGLLAAPSELIVDVSEKKVTFHTVGGSRVEYKWPKTGVVCEHSHAGSARECDNLQPGEHYEIVDLHDNKKRTFFLIPDAPMKDGVCLAGAT